MNSESALEALQMRIQVLEDQEAVRDLRHAYHEGANELKPLEMAELFAEDATLDYGDWGTAEGRAAIGDMFRRSIGSEGVVPFTKQFIHNHRFQLDGDRGTGRSYLVGTPVYNGESFLFELRFDDEYVKRDGRWYFQSVTARVYFMVPLKEGWAQDNLIQMNLDGS